MNVPRRKRAPGSFENGRLEFNRRPVLRVPAIVVYPAIFTVATYLFFATFLGVRLPVGFVRELLAQHGDVHGQRAVEPREAAVAGGVEPEGGSFPGNRRCQAHSSSVPPLIDA